MDLIKGYVVAGHLFSVSMSSNEDIWQKMDENYGAFEVEVHEKPLFSLSLCEEDVPLDISPVYIDPNKRSEDPKLDVYLSDNGYFFGMRMPFTETWSCHMRIDRNFHTAYATVRGNESERLSAVNSSLMLCYLLATAKQNTVLIHASAVLNCGKAYLFLGKSGTGKSTHSRLWQQHVSDTTLLNDDHPIVRVNEQGMVIVYGSPWSGKTPCYRNESALVGGIVRIKQAPQNNIKLLSPVEAYASLLTSCSGMTWERDLGDCKDQTLQQIISTIPCWTLHCLPDEAAARLCNQTIIGKFE